MSSLLLKQHTTLPEPDPAGRAHSERMLDHIYSEIAKAGGAISFAHFMELALYAPGLGYYRAGARKFGAGGDFVTAPELSPLFSRCLARQCQQLLQAIGGGIIVELGAGTGIMAADILQELQTLGTLPERYAILELSGELRERQRHTLTERIPHLLDRVSWLDQLPESGVHGILLANEVVDALPVERFHITTDGPRRLNVSASTDYGIGTTTNGLCWTEGTEDAALTAAIAAIEAKLDWQLPEGYVSEYVPQLHGWIQSLADKLAVGALLFIDYGYAHREYYHPDRTDGTLLCHYRHRVHDNPLLLPGLQDITASVNFSALADAGRAAGLTLAGYTSQSYFLFGCGLMDLLAPVDPEDTVRYLEQVRQVKLLTLPGEMGERFKAIALTRGIELELCGFSFRDERGRL